MAFFDNSQNQMPLFYAQALAQMQQPAPQNAGNAPAMQSPMPLLPMMMGQKKAAWTNATGGSDQSSQSSQPPDAANQPFGNGWLNAVLGPQNANFSNAIVNGSGAGGFVRGVLQNMGWGMPK